MKHTLLFTRQGTLGEIVNTAVCTFESEETDAAKALKKAVSRWIAETPQGKEAYAQSMEDFNIGDLGCDLPSENELAPFGVANLTVTTLPGENHLEYDNHLFQEDLAQEPVTPENP